MTTTEPAPHPVRGLDGKRYPGALLPAEDRGTLIAIVHEAHCREGLSVRRTLARIQERHQIRRSVGWVAGVLKDYRCDGCSGVLNEAPEQPPAA